MKFDVMNADDLNRSNSILKDDKAKEYMMYLMYTYSRDEIIELIRECKKEIKEDIAKAINQLEI